MLLRTAKGTIWSLHFRHTNDLNNRRMTICTVHSGKCQKDVRPCEEPNTQTGIARCAAGDQFDRRVGRQLSLTRAIEKLSRETRTQIWIAYRAYNPIDEQFRRLLHAESGRWLDNRQVGEST